MFGVVDWGGHVHTCLEWWTGVDMSSPLLPEGVPEIDADPVSFSGGGGGRGSVRFEVLKFLKFEIEVSASRPPRLGLLSTPHF